MSDHSSEIWKDVKGYEGYYQVSNLARVRSLERVVIYRDGRVRKFPGVMRTTKVHKALGYPMVQLSKHSKIETCYVHILVARAFMEDRPINCEINHKDGNKSNSQLINLEWVTHSENMKHSIRVGCRKVYYNRRTKKNEAVKRRRDV